MNGFSAILECDKPMARQFVRKGEKHFRILFSFSFFFFCRNTREIVSFILEYLSRAEIVSLRCDVYARL